MPINDGSTTYTEKIANKIAITSTPSSLKNNTQHDMPLLHNTSTTSSSSSSSNNSPKHFDNTLFKQQCHKWQEIFDFNKVLKQLQNEKRGKHDSHNIGSSATTTTNANVGNGGSSNSTNASNINNISNNGRETLNNGERCVAKQVQRLNGGDMHFYGVAPKQEALDVVVCNICMGIYTMMGFNNHMQLHHPTVWSTVSTKLTNSDAVSASLSSTFGTHANDNSQDSVRDPVPANELVLGSPSDLSGTMSTCSNASSSSSSLSSTTPYGVVGYTSSHHKSRKNGSTASSSGGSSSSGGRSRSKSKHHSSSSSPSVHSSSASSATSATDMPTASKSSKKNLSVNLSNVAHLSTGSTIASSVSKDLNAHLSSGGNGKSTEQTVSAYSTSSSSSSSSSISSGSGSGSTVTGINSLPPTPKIPKITNTTAEIANALATPTENSFVSGGLLPISETKEKHAVEASNKKKGTSPAFISHEGSIDSSASSSSSLENDRANNFKSSTANGSSVRANRNNNKTAGIIISNGSSSTNTNTSTVNSNNSTVTKPSSGKDLSQYSAQISELDQAVSSITECHDANSNNNKSEMNIIENTLTTNGVVDGNSVINNALTHGISATAPMAVVANYANFLPAAAVGCDESMSQQTNDDNSILTLEDMLDTKFINDILNTAETEIHFDENELDNDTTSQQAYGQPQQQQPQQQQTQQPPVKRMRYEDDLANGYAVFQQQQQHQQQQQSYEGYDEQQAAVAHYQAQTDATQQITHIDAMQLQQLLYQQQQQQQHYTGGANGAQAYDPQTGALVDAKQLIDLCGDEELQKHQQQKQIFEAEAKLADYATLTSLGGVGVGMGVGVFGSAAESQQFDVYNVPSLTDDMCGVEDVDMLLPTLVTGGGEHHPQQQQEQQHSQQQQYVLPSNEEQLIYEITANNQVAVMSQQRQQQVIAEFLTQAGYDNVDQHMQTTAATVNATGEVSWPLDDDDDMLDYDFSRLDTVKSLTVASNSNDLVNLPKLEHTKYHEDYYVHVCIYAGVPKPLAINCFGLIKLPQAAATTFRKQLLSTRKANNSPTTLSSCINGVVGGGGGGVLTGSLTRYASLNAKTASTAASAPNYFTTLSGGSNEFSIGSITISNTPTSSIASGNTQQQQQAFGSQQKQTPIELTLNVSANANGPISNVQQRAVARSKGCVTALNAAYSGTAKAKATLLSGGASLRLNATRPPALALSNGKTIVVASNANPSAATSPLLAGTGGGADRGVKCVRRSLICKLDLNAQRRSSQQQQLSKQIAEVLQSGKSVLRQQQQNTNVDNTTANEQQQQQQLKLQRVRNFYERRRKLYNLNQHTPRPSFAQQPGKQQKLLKQQLLRSLCGLNSIKSGHGSGNTAAGDVMRVFV